MKRCSYLLAAVLMFLCVFAGCSYPSELENNTQTSWDLASVEPMYITEWPENEFTSQIVPPENGEMDYICDYSDSMRYLLVMKDMSEETTSDYVKELKKLGYSEIASEGNDVSVGTMMQRGNVILSIAYSGEMLSMLITIENDA